MARFTVACAALMVLLPVPGATQPASERPAPAALFAEEAPLALTLTADLRGVFRDRDTTQAIWLPATLQWKEGDSTRTMAVELTTRGHFRLKPSTCRFPPLRVRFPKDGKKGTPWAGQGTLKLVTHCRDYDQEVLQEYLVYRAYGVFTEMNLLTRLARFTYVDTGDNNKEAAHWGFFLEDDDDMAARVGGELVKEPGVTFGIAEQHQLALMSTFLYMVGNTDWSLPFLHNVKVVESNLRYYPVPYDFDWSGIVDAPYARPDYRLGTRSVRERVWRGPCLAPDDLEAVLGVFRAKKDTLYAVYRNQEGVAPKRLKESLDYLDEFYRLIADPRRAQRELRTTCR